MRPDQNDTTTPVVPSGTSAGPSERTTRVGATGTTGRHVAERRNAWTTTDVERALGRPARDVTDFARDAAAARPRDL